jgi:glycerol-3-phosphate acyltransferase PlsY
VLGRKWGLICFAGDTLKGMIPVLLAGYLFSSLGVFQMPGSTAWGWLAVAMSPILGHVFCPWLNFKGGKGVATSLGAMLAMYPAFTIPMMGTFMTWIALVAIWRYVSLGSVVGALLLPVYVLVTFMAYDRHQTNSQALGLAFPFLVAGVVLAVLVTWTHRPNIRRLLAGTESKVWQPKPKAADN